MELQLEICGTTSLLETASEVLYTLQPKFERSTEKGCAWVGTELQAEGENIEAAINEGGKKSWYLRIFLHSL